MPQLVVVAAHADDETIGAAGLLLARRAAVVHVTDGAPRDATLRAAGGPATRAGYARLRREEALAALAVAGLAPADVLQLGVVDLEAAAHLRDVARAVADLLRALGPRLVVTHAVEGGHPDHDATALAVRIARAVLARTAKGAPSLAEMTGYHLAADGTLATGVFLPGGPGARRRVLAPLDRAAKDRMLEAYGSQRAVLAPFRADAERFRGAPPLAPGRRPHPGPLFYEAKGWGRFEAVDAAARDAAARDAAAALGVGDAAWR
jgi:LmbE family N-acetylglucosaminyl deacetylase